MRREERGFGDLEEGIGVLANPSRTPCHAILSLNREGPLVAE